jgi:hypothetical protein
LRTDPKSLSRFGVSLGQRVVVNGAVSIVMGCNEGRLWYREDGGVMDNEAIWCDWSQPPITEEVDAFDEQTFSYQVNEICQRLFGNRDGDRVSLHDRDAVNERTKNEKQEVEEDQIEMEIDTQNSSNQRDLFHAVIDYFSSNLSVVMRHLCVPIHYLLWIKRMRYWIHFEAKKKVLRSSFHPDLFPTNIHINREIAIEARYCTHTDTMDEASLLTSGFFLLQLFRALKASTEPKNGFFRSQLFQQSHAFSIRSGYADNAVDLKGIFRNFLSDVASEWWGSTAAHGFPLFLPSDTQNQQFSEYQDISDRYSWIPNPQCSLSFHQQLYRLIGQMIGCIIYSNVQVELFWPSVVWKYLIGKELETDDFLYFNTGMPSLLKRINTMSDEEWSCECGGISDCIDVLPVLLKSEMETERLMTQIRKLAWNCKKTEISLSSSLNYPNDSTLSLYSIPPNAREKLCQVITDSFGRYCKFQLDAIRDGLYSGKSNLIEKCHHYNFISLNLFQIYLICIVIPEELCQLFDEKEFEELVCGPSDYSMSTLKRNMTSTDLAGRKMMEWVCDVRFST